MVGDLDVLHRKKQTVILLYLLLILFFFFLSRKKPEQKKRECQRCAGCLGDNIGQRRPSTL